MEYIVDISRKGIMIEILENVVRIIFDFKDSVRMVYPVPIDDIQIDEKTGKRIIISNPLHTYK